MKRMLAVALLCTTCAYAGGDQGPSKMYLRVIVTSDKKAQLGSFAYEVANEQRRIRETMFLQGYAGDVARTRAHAMIASDMSSSCGLMYGVVGCRHVIEKYVEKLKKTLEVCELSHEITASYERIVLTNEKFFLGMSAFADQKEGALVDRVSPVSVAAVTHLGELKRSKSSANLLYDAGRKKPLPILFVAIPGVVDIPEKTVPAPKAAPHDDICVVQ